MPTALRPGTRRYRYHGAAVAVIVRREEPDVEHILPIPDRFDPRRPMTGKLLNPLPARYRRRIRAEAASQDVEARARALGVEVQRVEPVDPYKDFRGGDPA